MGGDTGVTDGDAGDAGGLRPATNITGANWARSSIGYEFMLAAGCWSRRWNAKSRIAIRKVRSDQGKQKKKMTEVVLETTTS
jgi:hypothetical protein